MSTTRRQQATTRRQQATTRRQQAFKLYYSEVRRYVAHSKNVKIQVLAYGIRNFFNSPFEYTPEYNAQLKTLNKNHGMKALQASFETKEPNNALKKAGQLIEKKMALRVKIASKHKKEFKAIFLQKYPSTDLSESPDFKNLPDIDKQHDTIKSELALLEGIDHFIQIVNGSKDRDLKKLDEIRRRSDEVESRPSLIALVESLEANSSIGNSIDASIALIDKINELEPLVGDQKSSLLSRLDTLISTLKDPGGNSIITSYREAAKANSKIDFDELCSEFFRKINDDIAYPYDEKYRPHGLNEKELADWADHYVKTEEKLLQNLELRLEWYSDLLKVKGEPLRALKELLKIIRTHNHDVNTVYQAFDNILSFCAESPTDSHNFNREVNNEIIIKVTDLREAYAMCYPRQANIEPPINNESKNEPHAHPPTSNLALCILLVVTGCASFAALMLLLPPTGTDKDIILDSVGYAVGVALVHFGLFQVGKRCLPSNQPAAQSQSEPHAAPLY